MGKRTIIGFFITISVLSASLLLYCDLPSDPIDPENTKVSAVFKTADSLIFEHAVVDTINKSLAIGAAVYLPQNMDSVRVEMTEAGTAVIDTTFRTFVLNSFYDTVWVTHTFAASGVKKLTITPFCSVDLPTVHSNITVVDTPRAPVWTVDTLSYAMNITGEYTLDLCTICSDTDDDPITYSLLDGEPAGDAISGSTYSFTASEASFGTHFVTVRASDPSGAASELVLKLTISAEVEDTLPPEVTILSPADLDVTILSDSLSIDILCSDASGIRSVIVTLGESKLHLEKSDDHYLTVIRGFSKGKTNAVKVTATDSAVAENSTVKTINVLYPVTYSVFYNATSSTSGDVPVDEKKYQRGEEVVAAGNTGDLVKDGYTFSGWNTKNNGSGISYVGGAKLIMGDSDVELYAQWTNEPTYNVVYNGNGNTGGEVPVDVNNYEEHAIVTVRANTGSLVKTGSTIVGWNTKVDGNGIAYLIGATFEMGSEDVTLYAQWTINPTFTITYDGNDNTGGTVPVDETNYEEDATVTVKTNTGLLKKSGSTFAGWNTKADGNGIAYETGVTFEMGAADVTLYAQWTTNPTFTVIYDGNGSTSGEVPVDGEKYAPSALVTVKGNTGNLVKTGSIFSGWNTKANGSGTPYAPGTTLTMGSGDVTLYVQWTATYTVAYSGNGNTSGTVPTDATKYTNGSSVTVKANTGNLKKSGFEFAGWNTASNGSGTTRNPGETFTIGSANVTLYALWNPVWTFVTQKNVTSGDISECVLDKDGNLFVAGRTDDGLSLYKLANGTVSMTLVSSYPGSSIFPSLALGSDGSTIFLGTVSYIVAWNGSSWNIVDETSWNSVGGYGLNIGPDNVPYVAGMSNNNFKTLLRRLNSDGSWIDVIDADNNSYPITHGYSTGKGLFSVGSSTRIYAIGAPAGTPQELSASIWNGTYWNNSTLETDATDMSQLQIVSSGYNVFCGYTISVGAPKIYRLINGSWSKLPAMTSSTVGNGALALWPISSGEVYAARTEGSNVIVKKYGGSSWVNVPSTGNGIAFTSGCTRLQVLSNANKCYIVEHFDTYIKISSLNLN